MYDIFKGSLNRLPFFVVLLLKNVYHLIEYKNMNMGDIFGLAGKMKEMQTEKVIQITTNSSYIKNYFNDTMV